MLMPDLLRQAVALDSLGWLLVVVFLAGMVRGFSGFGTAMIFIPFASKVMEPVSVLIALTVMDIFGPIPNLPRAWRDGEPASVARLGLATLISLPLGVYLLLAVPTEVFRYAVSILAIVVPISLLAGLRYRGEITPKVLYAGGAVAGMTGGAVGLPGPPVIMLFAASTKAVGVIRANIMMYLFIFDIFLLFWLGVKGQLAVFPVVLGLLFFVPSVAGNVLGAAIFDPAREKLYRGIAYAVIFTAALTSLPLWD
ncbi:sulfite exporter TauE/SafE family protein [Lentibacter sp.]|uniref:sulfite exporter TauE/SafE family protein n=1 Tax=Lentibacter sp. TaxID=2024994 RepID=UPI003F6971E1